MEKGPEVTYFPRHRYVGIAASTTFLHNETGVLPYFLKAFMQDGRNLRGFPYTLEDDRDKRSHYYRMLETTANASVAFSASPEHIKPVAVTFWDSKRVFETNVAFNSTKPERSDIEMGIASFYEALRVSVRRGIGELAVRMTDQELEVLQRANGYYPIDLYHYMQAGSYAIDFEALQQGYRTHSQLTIDTKALEEALADTIYWLKDAQDGDSVVPEKALNNPSLTR